MQISDVINSHRDKFFQISILALLFSMILYYPAFAQSKEELKLLQMYFKEDELVASATRTLKPLSQVAENISIITAEEIESMNAHTVAEVLENIPGVFVEFQGKDFGSSSIITIQGSERRHVLFLLDGMTWNLMNNGSATTYQIPVEIIKRIEVIKGPASSAWGSSLGGVVNIVTRDVGDSEVPGGVVSASYGQGNSQDFRTSVYGEAGTVGYYLYAGRQDSDGLRDNRDFKNDSFYAKINIPLASDTHLQLTAGYSEPHIDFGELSTWEMASTGITRSFFTTASISADITRELDFEASLYRSSQKFIQENTALPGMGIWGLNPGELISMFIYDEDLFGGSAKLLWKDDLHNAVLGIDISDGNLEETVINSSGTNVSAPGIEKWAVFVNDTITIGDLSITPGIRHDYNSESGDFTSPSIGATYKLGDSTILRASVSKGFTVPPLLYTSGGSFGLNPNPSLEPEKVWSYQGGIESWMARYLKARVTIFHHDIKDEMRTETDVDSNNIYRNKGEIRRNGIEINVETAPLHNVSFKGGFAYVRKRLINEVLYESDGIDTATENYSYNVALKYDDNKSFLALLTGNYVWWDYDYTDTDYDAFIFDLNLKKKVYSGEKIEIEALFTAHNIFNSSYYTYELRQNPSRWVEAGLKLKF